MHSKPWVAAINRLLKAELRPNPRPKPGAPVEDKYWNGEDLAEAADVRANTVSDVIRGKREPSVETLVKIAKALGVSAATLLMDADEATAYATFRQSRATTTQTAAVEETVNRILEQRAEQMKADWLSTQTRAVLQEIAAPTPRPVLTRSTKRSGGAKSR